MMRAEKEVLETGISARTSCTAASLKQLLTNQLVIITKARLNF
ncbi:hypothetical protein IMCC9480_3561 [Oxalobacteraceae bacterium IMCC9480]|nr:hypothetical protein IMCC9480_3561 [Oxalobacteraceae bacterium IMCC9480]